MDIYGIISNGRHLRSKARIPNAFQYQNIVYNEESIEDGSFQIIIRNRSGGDVTYQDQKLLVALLGTLSIGNRKISVQDFVELYKRDADHILDIIKGVFNIVIIEKQSLNVKIINDHFGLMPIFYYVGNERIVFSTKLDFVRLNSGNASTCLDYTAILEQIYFNYTLGQRTYYRDICMQRAASILKFSFKNSQIKGEETIYWHMSEFFGETKLPYSSALNKYMTEFYSIVNSAVDNSESPVLALTAGYDTRATLAVLESKSTKIPCFSYGIKGSPDISIPADIKRQLGVDYSPLYLEGQFIDNFVSFAKSTIFHSDGLADLEKSNNEYAYGILSVKYSDALIGVFGSEFLKHHNFPSRLVSNGVYRYFQSNGECLLNVAPGSFNSDLLRDFCKDTCEYLRNNYLEKYLHLSNAHRLLLFYFYEAVRKYFMKELRIARYHINVITPFVDKHLVEILCMSELLDINSSGRMLNRLARMCKAHFVYSYIIKRYLPLLLDIATDRGYKPRYDLSFWSRFFIVPHYIKHKLSKKTNSYLYTSWARPFIEKYAGILADGGLLKPLFQYGHSAVAIDQDSEKLHRLLSLAVYLHGISAY